MMNFYLTLPYLVVAVVVGRSGASHAASVVDWNSSTWSWNRGNTWPNTNCCCTPCESRSTRWNLRPKSTIRETTLRPW